MLRDGNYNLKWRGGGPSGADAIFTPPKPKAAPKKSVFREDSENQDPALATPAAPASTRPPFGAPRWAKEAIKSSAEKRPDNAEKGALLSKNAAQQERCAEAAQEHPLDEEPLLREGYTWPDI
jgi:hypothetical protein